MRLGWATNTDFLAHVELRMQQGLTQTHNLRTNLGQREIHVHFEVEWEAPAAVLGGGDSVHFFLKCGAPTEYCV